MNRTRWCASLSAAQSFSRYAPGRELQVMALDSGLERLLTHALQANPNGAGIERCRNTLREAAVPVSDRSRVDLPVLVGQAVADIAARFLRR